MKKLFVLLVGFIFVHNVNAFHIFGGEFQLDYIDGDRYRINFYMYFDRVQVANPNPETSISVAIFENSSEDLVLNPLLNLISEVPLDPSLDECRLDILNISRLTYSVEVNLPAETFSHPAGYHIVWERCCRNESNVNLLDPIGTGATFVLYFPPVSIGNEPFRNSSPELNTPDLNYACIGQLYQTSFAGFDEDGDSLTYKLVLPLNSSAAVPIPNPSPKSEHMTVKLAPGLDLTNIIPGNPNLQIDPKGKISVSSKNPGFFTYAIEVSEYRADTLIGKVLRDYQLLVVDGCEPEANITNTAVRLSGSTEFFENEVEVTFDQPDPKCIDFLLVTDSSEGSVEAAGVDIIPVGFNQEEFFDPQLEGILIESREISEDSIVFEICFPDCSFTNTGSYTFDLIGVTGNCSVFNTDTVRVAINAPYLQGESAAFESEIQEFFIDIKPDETYQEVFRIIDTDGANLSVSFIATEGAVIDFVEAGLTLNTFSPMENVLDVTVNWEPSCSEARLVFKEEYQIGLALNNDLLCDTTIDTLLLNFSLSGIEDPYIVDLDSGLLQFQTSVGQTYQSEFNILDEDGDVLDVTLEVLAPMNTTFDELGIVLSLIEPELGKMNGVLEWTPDCSRFDYNQQSDIKLKLSINDIDICESQPVIYEINGSVLSDSDKVCVLTNTNGLKEKGVDMTYLGVDELQFTHPESEVAVAVFDLTGRILFQGDIRATEGIYSVKTRFNSGQIYVLSAGDEILRFIAK